jgi:pimeloyl-ACP methyl ester carboxylesterase/DNA-binding CsgD family transcriptional regulator
MDAPPVQYFTTSDGVDIAYAVCGSGTPFVFMPMGFNHVSMAWNDSPFAAEWLQLLAQRFNVVHYDGRGQGMSTRKLGRDFGLHEMVRDLEELFDHLQLNPAVLMGYASSAHAAIHYAVKNPRRLRSLVLVAVARSMATWPTALPLGVGRQNWDLFLQHWANSAPDPERALLYFRASATQEDFVTRVGATAASDVSDLLPQLSVPTLVIHARSFLQVSEEEATKLAAMIPHARLVLTDGIMLGDASQGIAQLERMLDAMASPEDLVDRAALFAGDNLSSREAEVLRLLAAGRSNQQIADELVISLNTVRRHVSNIFDKTGAANRAQAAVYAKDHGLA